MTSTLLPLTLITLLLASGCGSRSAYSPMQDAAYANRSAVTDSVFSSDTAVVSNEAIEKTLDGKITLKERSNIAVIALGWCAADPGESSTGIEILKSAVSGKYVGELTRVPAILLPRDRLAIPYIREAAARLQCEMVLIYGISMDIRRDRNLFAKDQAKTYFSIDAMLLHVRTGIVPWTTVIDQEVEVSEGGDLDRDLYEQARLEAIRVGLAKVGGEMNRFIAGIP